MGAGKPMDVRKIISVKRWSDELERLVGVD